MRAVRSICILLSLLMGHAAYAEPSGKVLAEAQRRFSKGNRLYQDGHYEQALRLYIAAYELLPSPDILFNIGLAREKVLDYEGCALSLQQYLEDTAPADTSSTARQRATKRLEGCLARAEIPVKVSSIPPGAAIVLGEGESAVFRGRTPSEFKLAPGTYQVAVELPGYVPLSQKIKVEVGVRRQVDFPLEKLSSLGIEADVSGAWVSIDDGKAEPAPHRAELRAGRYRVSVFKEGHHEVKREVRIEPGDRSTLMVTLPPKPVLRTLSLRSEPPGAVTIDGEPAGQTPLTHKAKAGDHDLSVTAPGRVPFSGSIALQEDRDLALVVRLPPVRTRGNRAVFWSLIGGAGATATAGALYGLLALGDESDYGDTPTLDLADRGSSRARRADYLFATAAVLVGGAILYRILTRPSASRAEEK